ncbi:DUF397 domain-containing protein [Actinacidiphila yeochonensis]|uniref:DUF397 domain-containing protein n=1 Tax=Actinacidiphila yeochonensis TaxID=89050 RepID=UPI0005657987|nr:DUF397 domain-containing protein [Actinacidiphila yeochonensis]
MHSTHRFNDAQWRKSSYSNGSSNGACIEVALHTPGTVPVRDSKNSHGPVLAFTPAEWNAFLSAVREGELPTA